MTAPYLLPGQWPLPRRKTPLEEALEQYHPNRPQQLPDLVATAPADPNIPDVGAMFGQPRQSGNLPVPPSPAPPSNPLMQALLQRPDALRTALGTNAAGTHNTMPGPVDRAEFVDPAAARRAGLTGERNAAGLADIITGAFDPSQASAQFRAVQARQRGEDVAAPPSTALENFAAGAQRQLGGGAIDLEKPRAGWQMAGAALPFAAEAALTGPAIEGPLAARLGGGRFLEHALQGAGAMAIPEVSGVARGEESLGEGALGLGLGAAGGMAIGEGMSLARPFARHLLPAAAGAAASAATDDPNAPGVHGWERAALGALAGGIGGHVAPELYDKLVTPFLEAKNDPLLGGQASLMKPGDYVPPKFEKRSFPREGREPKPAPATAATAGFPLTNELDLGGGKFLRSYDVAGQEAHVTGAVDPETGLLNIDDVVTPGGDNALGTANVRKLSRQLQAETGATGFTGLRVGQLSPGRRPVVTPRVPDVAAPLEPAMAGAGGGQMMPAAMAMTGGALAGQDDDSEKKGGMGMLAAAIPLLMGYKGDPEAPGRLLGGRLYSRLYETAAAMKMAKAPVESWVSKLTGSGGFKKDEFDQVLRPWLEAQPRGTKLTKEDVLGAIQSNLPQLTESVQGYSGAHPVPAGTKLAGANPQWADYVPPGNENYRNVLLQTPPTKPPGWIHPDQQMIEHLQSVPTKLPGLSWEQETGPSLTGDKDIHWLRSSNPDQQTHATYISTPVGETGPATVRSMQGPIANLEAPDLATAQDAIERYYQTFHEMGSEQFDRALQIGSLRQQKPLEYHGPHWRQENVLAHGRLGDVVTPEGDRYLNVNELQSDWHQAGRKKGYRPPPATREQQMLDLYDTRQGNDTRPPEGPFSKTQDWMGLGLKRAIDEGVGGGYKGLTWSTPEAISDALQMSQHADVLELLPGAPGDRYAGGPGLAPEHQAADAGTLRLYRSGNRHPIAAHPMTHPDQLEELLGPELAQRLRATEPSPTQALDSYGSPGSRFLTGDGLTVYPKGNRKFYGEMIPDWLKAYGKEQGFNWQQRDVPVTGNAKDLEPSYVSRITGGHVDANTISQAAEVTRDHAADLDPGEADEIPHLHQRAQALDALSADAADSQQHGTSFHDWFRGLPPDDQELLQNSLDLHISVPPTYHTEINGEPAQMSGEQLRGAALMLGDYGIEPRPGGTIPLEQYPPPAERQAYRDRAARYQSMANELDQHIARGGRFHDWFEQLDPEHQAHMQSDLAMERHEVPTSPVLRTQKGFDFTPELLKLIATRGQPLLGLGAIMAAMAARHHGGGN